MCVKLKGSKMSPGQIHSFLTKVGRASGIWGFQNGSRPNARIESLPNVWSKIQNNRGILTVDSFWEKDKQFIRCNGVFQIGVVFNNQMEFAVITCPATGIVKPVHDRMPLLLSDDTAEEFLEDNSQPIQLDPAEIIFADLKIAV